ncbi:hypothetical protein PpBr36_08398 [Pyricularia pennisetigena]|uniref:hypothetical protein n=1 Tax=Pyricularia pennisetigena TaxID=1578925 RepID=UPI0011537D16|nr:hypothetical protein PpBr36_08398 [Pyricularia pennisetigena]TLS24779.1 hypothetical protein PpBr36_08398 [Pyricularia pennisetigena]
MPAADEITPGLESSLTSQWLICVSCGTQYPTTSRSRQKTCFICDDPRHYTPPAGQSFTTMAALRASGHRNVFVPYDPSYPGPMSPPSPTTSVASSAVDSNSSVTMPSSDLLINRRRPIVRPDSWKRIGPPSSSICNNNNNNNNDDNHNNNNTNSNSNSKPERLSPQPQKQKRYHPHGAMISIVTKPVFAMGQRCILVHTPAGNILWDCITLLDDDTVERIRSLGGLAAIVISHPHFYTAHAEWAAVFGCPVFLAAEDRKWVALEIPLHVFLGNSKTDQIMRRSHEIIIEGVRSGFVAVKLGGHFPGSMVAHFDGRLLISDTLLTTPAGLGGWDADAAGNVRSRPAGVNTFAFMWSGPNSVPLSAEDISRIWEVLKRYQFKSTHGAFLGEDIEDATGMKRRVLESIQIQIRRMGWTYSPLLTESVPSLI